MESLGIVTARNGLRTLASRSDRFKAKPLPGEQRRPVLVAAYLMLAMASLAVPAMLLLVSSPQLLLVTVVVYGGLKTAPPNVLAVYMRQALLRGTTGEVHGRMFSLTYHVCPVFAVVGSLGSQWIMTSFEHPAAYGILFTAVAVLMLINRRLPLGFQNPLGGPENRDGGV